MKLPVHFSVTAAALMLAAAGAAFSAPAGFELDVRELSPAPQGGTVHKQRPQRSSKAAAPPVAATGDETSTYTVRPGDHLFLILMRHYGLSNNEAERRIPEVMRLNGIGNPRALTPGQRVVIPLAARTHRDERHASRPAPKESPSGASSTVTASAAPASPPSPLQLEIAGGPSCQVGKAMAEKLGLLVPSSGVILGFPNFAVAHAGVTLEVACGLSSAEQYTYEQLLSRHNIQLLVFGEMEPSRRVIEKIANRLNLIYRTEEPAGHNRLPLRVHLRSIGDGSGETKLTVLAGD